MPTQFLKVDQSINLLDSEKTVCTLSSLTSFPSNHSTIQNQSLNVRKSMRLLLWAVTSLITTDCSDPAIVYVIITLFVNGLAMLFGSFEILFAFAMFLPLFIRY